jgi:hypothetical protein
VGHEITLVVVCLQRGEKEQRNAAVREELLGILLCEALLRSVLRTYILPNCLAIASTLDGLVPGGGGVRLLIPTGLRAAITVQNAPCLVLPVALW